MEWNEIAKYIDAGVLLLIIILFARGLIVSKKVCDDVRKTFQEALDKICQSHKEEINTITESFEKRMQNFMQIIEILKKRNHIK